MTLDYLLKELDLKFTDRTLIERVFIHRSYLNEAKDRTLESNERLEFLGDAVLELAVTEFLYSNYHEPEGVLTNWRAALVRGEMISKVADSLGLFNALKLSKGEQTVSGKARGLMLANTFEALLGAIYLDLGYARAEKFVHDHLLPQLDDILTQKSYIDSKSRLQEVCQRRFGQTPTYVLESQTGPDHNKEFTVKVLCGAKELASGTGLSKQRAEQDAARVALTSLEG